VSWFRVDDKAAFHVKVLKAGNESFGALIRMGCWSSDHLTDGRIPIETACLIATDHTLQKLCYVGFLEPDGDDFIIHDYLDYNPTAEEVRAQREEKHESKVRAGRVGGIASGVARRSSEANGEAKTKQNEAPSRPDPVPIPKEKNTSRESFDFDAVYSLYPLKLGKKKGLQRCRSQIKTREKYDALLRAVKNYTASVRDPQFYKHFDTFMGCWEDYIEPLPLLTGNGKSRGHSAPVEGPSEPENQSELLR
jgi:hypothetical protein